MADLDDRFEHLRDELGRIVHADTFESVEQRHRRRVVRRSVVAAGASAVVVASVAWVVTQGGATDTLRQTPAGPSTPSENAAPWGPDSKIAAKPKRQLPANRQSGPTWTPEPTAFVANDIAFADASTGFIVGERCRAEQNQQTGAERGTCRKSVQTSNDGGRTWRSQPPFGPILPPPSARGTNDPASGDVSRVTAVSATTLWVYGPALYVSNDAGRTFRPVPVKKAVDRVLAVGNSVTIVEGGCRNDDPCGRATVYTAPANGSRPPRPMPTQPMTGPGTFDFAQPTASVAYGLVVRDTPGTLTAAAARIERTRDGGRSWQRLDVPAKCLPGLAGLSADSADSLWLLCAIELGAGSEPKQLFRSTDAGASWTEERPGPESSGYASDLVAVSGSAAWRSGGRATVARTVDGGRTWTYGPEVLLDAGATLAAVDSRHAWALTSDGPNGSDGSTWVWRTSDGVRWSAVRLPP